jgi:hypothetical protein
MEAVLRVVQQIAMAICLLILANLSYGQNKIIETFPEGQIDWGKMTITVIGIGHPDPELSPARARISAVAAARVDAGQKLLAVFKRLNLDSKTSVASFLNRLETVSNQVENYFTEFKIIDKPRLMPDSTVELTAEYFISEDILNALLPDSTGDTQNSSMPIPPSKSEPTAYTGLIVDCRGLDISPAFFPRVLDEKGNEVYGASRVDRSAIITSGLVEYYCDDKLPERVGGNPYKIKALRVSGANRCDVIIAADDAAIANSVLEDIIVLNKCKVVFLVK